MAHSSCLVHHGEVRKGKILLLVDHHFESLVVYHGPEANVSLVVHDQVWVTQGECKGVVHSETLGAVDGVVITSRADIEGPLASDLLIATVSWSIAEGYWQQDSSE